MKSLVRFIVLYCTGEMHIGLHKGPVNGGGPNGGKEGIITDPEQEGNRTGILF